MNCSFSQNKMANLTIAENSENRKKIENCGKLAEFTERQQKCGK